MADKTASAEKIATAYMQKKGMEKEAFNRFNAPEVLAALFTALEKAGLRDTVNTLKQKGIARIVNDAWMKKRRG